MREISTIIILIYRKLGSVGSAQQRYRVVFILVWFSLFLAIAQATAFTAAVERG